MKTALTITGLVALSTAIGSFTWIPGAVDGTRNYMIEPAIEAIQGQTIMMAQMKKYDIDTDELSDDVRILKEKIRAAEDYLSSGQPILESTRRFLKIQLESERLQLIQKGEKLHQSKLIDQKTLSTLQGQSS